MSDTVFAVKDDLVVEFKPRKDDSKAKLDLEYNVILAPDSYGNPGANAGQTKIDLVNSGSESRL